jgi:hypothetical protein
MRRSASDVGSSNSIILSGVRHVLALSRGFALAEGLSSNGLAGVSSDDWLDGLLMPVLAVKQWRTTVLPNNALQPTGAATDRKRAMIENNNIGL